MTDYDPKDYELVQRDGPVCDGCAFAGSASNPPWCKVAADDALDCGTGGFLNRVFVKREQ